MSDRDLSGLKRKHYLIHLGAESFRIRPLFEGLKAIHVKNILVAQSPADTAFDCHASRESDVVCGGCRS